MARHGRIDRVLTDDEPPVRPAVRVAATPLIVARVLAPRLGDFDAEHPGVALELVAERIAPHALDREPDVAIRLERPTREPGAIVRRLGVLTYGVYRVRGARTAPSDDEQIPWVGFGGGGAVAPLAACLERLVMEDRYASVRHRVGDDETAVSCVLAGVGQSLIPDAVGERHPELEEVAAHRPALAREVWVVARSSLRTDVRLRATVRWVEDGMNELLRDEGDDVARP